MTDRYRSFLLQIFLLAIFSLGHSLRGNAQSVKEFVKLDSLKVGDTFSYAITLSKDQSYEEITFPDSTHWPSPFDIRSRQQFRITEFKDSLVYTIQFFGTEDTTIPRLPVKLVNGSDTSLVYTTPVPVHFQSVLQAGDEEFRPLKPIFDFAAAWWPYLLVLLLLIIAGWYAYRLYMKKSREPESAEQREFVPAPFQDPLKKLASELSRLKSYTFSSEEDFKQFYIDLGDAIREYFEHLYHIPALESTSREILLQLQRRSVDEELIKKTRAVLQEADMVKFAKFTPSKEQAQKALAKGDDFLKRARQIDNPRIDQLRRQYHRETEEQREAFEETRQLSEETA